MAFATGYLVVYGLNVPAIFFEGKTLSPAETHIYGGFHRLAWGMAVGWVIFACCRGYGGRLINILCGNIFCNVIK